MSSLWKTWTHKNICRSKNGKRNAKLKFTSHYFNCKKQGHQEHECRSKASNIQVKPIFEGYFYNYHKYGHKAQECRSKEKPNWTPKKQDNAPKQDKKHNWEYNTWRSFHYCQEYGYGSMNYIRKDSREKPRI